MPDYYTNALKAALRHLSGSVFIQDALQILNAETADVNARLSESVIAEIPAYSESRNPDVLPVFTSQCAQHTAEILRLLDGGAVGDFDFVREHAQQCAEQHFPLEATLHAYRCSHKVFSRWIREAILVLVPSPEIAQLVVAAVADFTIEYTDAVSTVYASTYVSQIRLLADVTVDQRTELLTILLSGYDESDGRVAKILRDAGYLDRRQSFCVALVQSVNPAEMLSASRARRVVSAIDEILQPSSASRLIDVHDNKVVVIFSDIRRISGWTAPHAALAKKLASMLSLAGNAVLIGVSNDVVATSQIPAAYKEAQYALELADVTQRVVQFSEVPTRRFLLYLAGEEFQKILPPWAREFFRADDKANGALSATLQAYANADMNVLKAAQLLSVHPNTIYSRFQKILDITGQDVRSFQALSELLIISDCRPALKTAPVSSVKRIAGA